MQEDKNKVETILFTTGRFIGLEELGRLAGIGSLGYLKEVIDELKKGYETKNGSLQITEQGSKYKLAIKKEALSIMKVTSSDALAEILGCAVLAGELSLLSSLAEGSLAKAHTRLGR